MPQRKHHLDRIAIALQAGVGTFANSQAWMWVLGHDPATKVRAFAFLMPLWALLFGGLWLGEAITPALPAALALVAAAAAGIVLLKRSPHCY